MTGPELQEHSRVYDDIDLTYLSALNGATGVRTYISMPRGDKKTIYNNFYSPFVELFQHTYQIPDVSKSGDENEVLFLKIKRWIDYNPDFSQRIVFEKHMKAGLFLFDKYQKILLDLGVINVSQK